MSGENMDFDWDDDYKDELPEDEDEDPTEFKPTYILLAIDVGPSMFKKGVDGKSPFSNCIKGLRTIIDKMLIKDKTSLRSPLGVVLASNNQDKFHLIKFTDDMIHNFNTITNLAEKDDVSLSQMYQRAGTIDLDNFFVQCQKCLLDINADVYKRNIVFVTNDDDPKLPDDVKFRALNIAKGFPSHKLYLDVITYNSDFDYEMFYDELLKEAGSIIKKEYLENSYSFACKVDELLVTRLIKRQVKFYPNKGDLNKYIALFQHNFVKETKIYNNFCVTSDTAEPVVKLRVPNDDNTEVDMLKATYATTDFVEVTKVEQKLLKDNDLPKGYTFLYVDERKSQYGHLYERPNFLEVNENKPNKQYFLAFWKYCFEKNRVLVCARKYTSEIRFVELIPRIIDKKKMFMSIVLPTSEDRNYECDKAAKPREASDRCRKEMSKLVDEMSGDYHPNRFYSVSMRRKMAYIKFELTGEKQADVPLLKEEKAFANLEQAEVVKEFLTDKRGFDDESDDRENWIDHNITGYVPQAMEELTKKPPAKKRAPRGKK